MPVLPCFHPFLLFEDLSDQLLHARALLEFEQVPKLSLLGSHHSFLRTPMTVPGQEYWPLPLRHPVAEFPQCRLCIQRSRLVSRLHLHVHYHSDIRCEVTVIGMRRSPSLGRVISHLRVSLDSVSRAHCAVHL